jgi:O-methyltransferase involved in polyketide biosynthesis
MYISEELDLAQAEPLVRNISDTALLAAVYRARETERPDALFRDPFARPLAGKRGDQIAVCCPAGLVEMAASNVR